MTTNGILLCTFTPPLSRDAAIACFASVFAAAHSIELQQRLIKEGVETAVGDSQRIGQLTTAVFTAAFEPVKKRIEAVQNAAHP
jgi:hypothetical protein